MTLGLSHLQVTGVSGSENHLLALASHLDRGRYSLIANLLQIGALYTGPYTLSGGLAFLSRGSAEHISGEIAHEEG